MIVSEVSLETYEELLEESTIHLEIFKNIAKELNLNCSVINDGILKMIVANKDRRNFVVIYIEGDKLHVSMVHKEISYDLNDDYLENIKEAMGL